VTSEWFELLALPVNDGPVVLCEPTHGVVPCCSSVRCSSQCAHLTKCNYITSAFTVQEWYSISLWIGPTKRGEWQLLVGHA